MSAGHTAITTALPVAWQDEQALACNIREVLNRIGDKWSVLVITELSRGVHRFRKLQRAVPGISQRMLTLTLRRLERDALVTRIVFTDSFGEGRVRAHRHRTQPHPLATERGRVGRGTRPRRDRLTCGVGHEPSALGDGTVREGQPPPPEPEHHRGQEDQHLEQRRRARALDEPESSAPPQGSGCGPRGHRTDGGPIGGRAGRQRRQRGWSHHGSAQASTARPARSTASCRPARRAGHNTSQGDRQPGSERAAAVEQVRHPPYGQQQPPQGTTYRPTTSCSRASPILPFPLITAR